MVKHKCERCLKEFNRKSNYDYHMNKKNTCKTSKDSEVANENEINKNIHNDTQNIHNDTQNTENDAEEIEKKSNKNEWLCNYCKKSFTTNSSYNRHLSKFCKIKKNNDRQKEDLMTKLIREKDEQNKKFAEILAEKDKQFEQIMTAVKSQEKLFEKMTIEIMELKKGTKLTNKRKIIPNNNTQHADLIQNNINNCNNKIQNIHNIKIIAYGKEDLSHILENDYKMILNKGFKSIPALMESIHFNKNKPENHNIYISNMRDNYVLVYNGDDWQLKERDDVLQNMVYNNTDKLNEKFEELMDELDEPTIRKFNRFLDKKDDNDVMNSIKKDLKLLMYNKRKIIEDTRKIIDDENEKIEAGK